MVYPKIFNAFLFRLDSRFRIFNDSNERQKITQMAQRRLAREVVLKALYAAEIGKDEWTHIIKTVIKSEFEEDLKSFKFAERLFLKVVNHREIVDEVIQKHIKNWRIDRLTTIDRLVLRMAIIEFLYFDQIPTKVTMNEAIEIAKRYSTKKSGNFVNGILDAALGQLQKEDRIDKKGRGRIESSFSS